MNDIHLDTKYFPNYPIDPNKEPDRFTRLSGKNNYRSGRIVTYEQLKLLRDKYGIKNIINLAKDSYKHQDDERFDCGGMRIPCEPLWAKDLGLNYYTAYMSNKPPSQDKLDMIEDLLTQGNTLIHCTWGVDRTGAVSGWWNRRLIPNLTDRDILNDYTYKFGGQWLLAEDHNRHLREWIQSVNHDPQLRSEVEKSIKGNSAKIILAMSTALSLYLILS